MAYTIPALPSALQVLVNGGTVTNNTSTRVYYRDRAFATTSGSDADGFLDSAGTATLVGAQWFASALGSTPRASVSITLPPATSSSSTGGVARTASAIAYASSITPTLPTSGDAVYVVGTLTGNLSVVTPSGTPADGQLIKFRFTQDATGRTLTFDSGYSFGTDVQAAMFPTAASAKFEVMFEYALADLKWRSVGTVRGF